MKTFKVCIAVSLFVFTACSNKTNQEPKKTSVDVKQVVNKAMPDSNILKTNICELISAKLLAETLGGKVLRQPQHSDYGTTQGCEYEIDPPGSDKYEYCAIWFYPVSLYENSESALENTKGLNQKATVEKLTGYGDESYVIHNKSEEQSIIHILLKGESYIEVKAENFKDAKKIAELVLSKIK